MEKVKKEILIILKELKEEDFKEFKWHLNHPSPEDHRSIPRSDLENKDRMDTVDLMEQYYGKDFVQVAVEVLKEIQRNDLAEKLSQILFLTTGTSKTDNMDPGKIITNCQRELKSNLKKKFQRVFEGIAKAGKTTLLNEIYTELYITEGGTAEVNEEHEIRQIETASWKPDRLEKNIRLEDLLKASAGGEEPIRTVMTKGVAGIGKTLLTQKFTLDWAEDKDHQDIQFTFPFTFRELNVQREKKFS
uniref:Pyrin domain-containing protein n=1 Tax=Gasterosteus aculeatus TaxID=69293 RepID=G3N8D6_GASAC